MPLKAVFFDLDGTLLDTAMDLANALDKLLLENGKQALALGQARNVVSDGARALLELGFNITPDDETFPHLRKQLLDHYLNDLARHTQPFEGIAALIENLHENGIHWGIATNKPWRYTEPLMKHFQFASPPVVTLCPEHVKERKPAPESLLLACERCQCDPADAIYIGDHPRDITCGIRAGMETIAVGYGYFEESHQHTQWGATYTVEHANEIWPLLQRTRLQPATKTG